MHLKNTQEIISSMKGYVSHQLLKRINKNNRHILIVNWKTLEDHTVGFRESKEYKEWRALLHHFINHSQKWSIMKIFSIMPYNKRIKTIRLTLIGTF